MHNSATNMDVCRICLTNRAPKDILDLEIINNTHDDKKSCVEVMIYCLNIQVLDDLKITTKLCLRCYKKLASFYEFKLLALKSDTHLKSLNETIGRAAAVKDETLVEEHFKVEEALPVPDILQEDIKVEYYDSTNDAESEDEYLSDIKRVKYEICEDTPVSGNFAEENVALNDSHHKKKPRKKKAREKEVRIKVKSKQLKVETVCDKCGKVVKNLRKHLELHNPDSIRKRYPCQLCDKSFVTPNSKSRHLKNVHLGKKSKCTICNKDVIYLKQHQLLKHSRELLQHECASCSKRFLSKSALEVHMLSHTNVKAFSCDLCNKKYNTQGWLNEHKRTAHEQRRRFQCKLCPKAFFKNRELQIHLRTHSGEKPFQCPDCGSFYKSRATLSSHQLTHNKEKALSCPHCDMQFHKREYLYKHIHTHTKVKNYPCQYCTAMFRRSDHRKRHEFTAHEKLNKSKADS